METTSSTATANTTPREPLSEKAKANYQRNKEQRIRDARYIELQEDEERALYFDLEKSDTEPSKFDSKKVRYVYVVVDPNFADMGEKLFTCSKKLSEEIDEFLIERQRRLLLVKKTGEGFDTRYTVRAGD